MSVLLVCLMSIVNYLTVINPTFEPLLSLFLLFVGFSLILSQVLSSVMTLTISYWEARTPLEMERWIPSCHPRNATQILSGNMLHYCPITPKPAPLPKYLSHFIYSNIHFPGAKAEITGATFFASSGKYL